MSDAEATEHALWVIELLTQQGFDVRALADERDRRRGPIIQTDSEQ